MPKHIEVIIRKSGPTYELLVAPRGPTAPGRAVTDEPDSIPHTLGQMLVPIFNEGDVIDFCNVEHRSIDAAIALVKAARVDWEEVVR